MANSNQHDFLLFYLLFVNTGFDFSKPKPVINPVRDHLKLVGLYLAAHKYFEVDRRKGSEMTWKYDERIYHRHFPVPRLKQLEPEVRAACDQGVLSCIEFIATKARASFSLKDITLNEALNDSNPAFPFNTPLELFQFRTTAAYFMCWFTMQRSEYLSYYMNGLPCLTDLEKVQEKDWADKDVVDFRNDTKEFPFQCAEIHFCPNFCYGKKSGGSVPSSTSLFKDGGNPCRKLKVSTCSVHHQENTDFDGLQRNMFNVSCHCERSGFVWNSRFELCVDIDECKLPSVTCSKGLVCQNLPGSHKCVCRKGHKHDAELDQCVEIVPLPSHTLSRTGRVKAIRQKTALMALFEYIIGLKNSTEP